MSEPQPPSGSSPPLSNRSGDLSGPTIPLTGSGRSGEEIGQYRLVERVGVGGMGEVWRAEQLHPVRRIVAVKLIRRGMQTDEVIARFESERQALALMDHPSIAKVFDAGATADGSPFFVMEYVRGVAITEYCDQHRLSTRDRLRLFRKVCEAVQHAHQKAVIHRDLKPGNILISEVDGRPHPIIIDFGIAKSISQRLSDQSMMTLIGQVLGTLEYMSPEQAGGYGGDVDTRSDIFSLGVILYELIAGVLPLTREELGGAALAQIVELICKRDPPRPSNKLSTMNDRLTTIATLRRTDPRHLLSELRGDLDWVVTRALERDRNRRYGSAFEFAADVERFLRGDPVAARPPSPGYRFNKFVRRHRVGMGIAAGIVITVIGFTVSMTVQAKRIATARRYAEANELAAYGFGKLTTDPTAAVAYGLAGLDLAGTPQTRELFARALAAGPIRFEVPRVGPRNPITVDVSRDGRWCGVGWSREGAVTLYSILSWASQTVSTPGGVWTLDVAFTSDDRYLLSLCQHVGLLIRSIPDMQLVAEVPLTDGQGRIFPLEDPNIALVNVKNEAGSSLWYRIMISDGSVDSLGAFVSVDAPTTMPVAAASPRGQWIAEPSGGQIWLARPDDLSGPRRLVGEHGAALRWMEFDPTGEQLAAVDESGKIDLWDLGEEASHLTVALRDIQGIAGVRFDRQGTRLLSFGQSGVAHLWDLAGPPLSDPIDLRDRTFWVHDGAFTPDGSIVTVRNGAGVAYWPNSYRLPVTIEVGSRNPFLGSGEDCLWADGDDNILVVPVSDRRTARPEYLLDPSRIRAEDYPLSEAIAPFIPLEAWPNGDGFLAYDRIEKSICRIDLGTKNLGYGMRVSSSGRYVAVPIHAANNQSASLGVIDRETGHVFHRQEDTDLATLEYDIDFEFRQEQSLVVAHGNTLLDWDFRTGDEKVLWTGDLKTARFAGDASGLVVMGSDGDVRWLDSETGEEVPIVNWGRGATLTSVSRFEDLIAITGRQYEILVFSMSTGQRWRILDDRSTMWTVSFDPQGRWLLAGTRGIARLWSLPLNDYLLERSESQLRDDMRDLTNVRIDRSARVFEGFALTVETGR